MKDQITNEPQVETPLDNWYGVPKKVGYRDLAIGIILVAVIVLIAVVTIGFKDLNKPHQAVCPKCHNQFIVK